LGLMPPAFPSFRSCARPPLLACRLRQWLSHYFSKSFKTERNINPFHRKSRKPNSILSSDIARWS